ncbi:MAG: rRNA pseudouridine synthase [Alphaproteobacteria bacterium]|nr:rRNA pseudouridine synthase [Alphaproteobacteria bacterium]
MAESEPQAGMRIARRLAQAGLCSRREAERWVAEGRVAVDGQTLATPATVVTDGQRVTVDGAAIPAALSPHLFRYHKPAGLLTTHRDPAGRPTVFERLPAELPRLISVGRLDINSEGLLLLTTDGALARHLELPATGWRRRYRVRVHGAVDPKALAALKTGIEVAGVRYGEIEAAIDRVQGSNAWLTISLREGRNREVRRVMAHLGLAVTRLIRTAYGPFQLGALPKRAIEEVQTRALAAALPADWQIRLARPRHAHRRRQP